MIKQKLKSFVQKNPLMTANLVVGGLLSVCLFLTYFKSHQDYYLDLLQGLVACEGLIISLFLVFKLLKSLRIETTLKEDEERLKLFTSIMEEAILIRDGQTIVEVNDVLANLLGYEISEMIGRNVYDFMDPPSAEKNKEWMMAGYPTDRSEIVAKRKDGTTFPLLIRGRDIVYKGKPMRLSCGWDITELRKMEEKLQKSEERFKGFAEITHEGILIHDNGLIVDVNQALAEMVGMSPLDFIGKDSLFFVDGKSAKAIKDFRAGLIPALPYEITLVHADGSLVPCETYATSILWQGKEHRAVRIWNVTERKRIEKALVESQERFKRFAEVTKEGILVHDKGVVLDVNQAILDMLGCEASEVIGKNNFFFMDEESKKKVQKLREGGYSTEPYEVTLRRKDGKLVPVEVNGVSFSWGGQELRVVRIWDLTERKKMEEALIESQERFKRFTEVSREGIVIHENGVVVDVNPAGAEMLGYSPDDAIGRQTTEFLDEESRKRALQHYQAGTFAKGEEVNVVRKDKTTVPVEMTGALLSLKGKNLRITNFWDLSERKKIEEALRKSEDSFRNLIEKSPDAIIIHTLDKTVYVNDAMLNLLGYSKAEELIGTFPTSFVHPEDVGDVHKRIHSLKKPGDYNPSKEKRFVRQDGTILFVDVISFMIYFEGVPMTVAVARDLTERKKVEEALRQSEKNFRHLIEKSPDGVLIHNLDHEPKIIYVNDAMLQFVDYSAEELMGQKADFFVHSKHVAGVQERIARMKAQGEYNPPQEKMFIRKDGEIVHAEAVSFLIHYEGVPMAAVVARDLTERKKAEEALMKFERLSTIGEMAAGMAHEIRNPLAAISTAAQILLRKRVKENSDRLKPFWNSPTVSKN